MVVKRSYKPHWPDELALTRGEFILVLCKDDEARWFGRLQNGQQGYFPASHVVELSHQVSGKWKWSYARQKQHSVSECVTRL